MLHYSMTNPALWKYIIEEFSSIPVKLGETRPFEGVIAVISAQLWKRYLILAFPNISMNTNPNTKLV